MSYFCVNFIYCLFLFFLILSTFMKFLYINYFIFLFERIDSLLIFELFNPCHFFFLRVGSSFFIRIFIHNYMFKHKRGFETLIMFKSIYIFLDLKL
jgi:hypothetical protein